MVLDRTISYRQVGGKDESEKYLPKRSLRKEPSKVKHTRASIPSKFETVLHFGSREVNAFGNRCTRFASGSIDTSTVGPGQYWSKPTLLKTADTCGSVSKKGYGVGFISKTKRFSNRKELESAHAPGPGDYKWSPSFQTRIDFSASNASRAFAETKSSGAFGGMHATPGPGAYAVGAKYTKRTSKMPSSSFKTNSKRGDYAISETPAPGSYNVASSWMPAHPKGMKRGKRSPPLSSMFCSTTNRQDALRVPGMMHTPGPGAYEGKTVAPKRRGEDRGSSFFSNEGHDRFGRPYNKKSTEQVAPGPGSYASEYRYVEKQMVGGSAFKSNVPRISRNRGAKPPGPAYYRPEVQNAQKSFLLNTKKTWV